MFAGGGRGFHRHAEPLGPCQYPAGAGLDVFDQEPLPPRHPLTALDNTLLVPHIGYVTREQYQVRYRDTVADVAAYLRGEPLRVLNPEALNMARK